MRVVRMVWMIMLAAVAMILVVGCCAPAPSAPAEVRTTAPPWPAPRDAVSSIAAAAGLVEQPLDLTGDQHLLTMSLTIDGQPVPLAADIGIDRPRAVQGVAHTHDASGTVWLEGREVDEVTLGQFFTLWGVRLTQTCLGAACGQVLVTTTPATDLPDPTALHLNTVTALAITVVSS